MTLIDKDELLEDIDEEIEYGEERINPDDKLINGGLRIARKLVKSSNTVEAITRGQYHDMTERFFDEFVDNGADEETVAKCMFIGLAFGKLELMLFGEDSDNNVKT